MNGAVGVESFLNDIQINLHCLLSWASQQQFLISIVVCKEFLRRFDIWPDKKFWIAYQAWSKGCVASLLVDITSVWNEVQLLWKEEKCVVN